MRALLAVALAFPVTAAGQEKLHMCLTMAEGSKGDAASWIDEVRRAPDAQGVDHADTFASVRAISSIDDARGCDAIFRLRLKTDFWGARVTGEILSAYSRKVLYQGDEKGWTLRGDMVGFYAGLYFGVGDSKYNEIVAEKVAQCRSADPPDTPFCNEIALRQREQEAGARRWAAEQAVREEARIREKIPAWLALKQRPPLPDEARKFRVLAEDALREKRFEEAAGYYERGLAIEPLWPEAHFNLAMLDGELRKFAQAASHMRLYLEMAPNAKDAQAAQDKIIIWDEKARLAGAAPASRGSK